MKNTHNCLLQSLNTNIAYNFFLIHLIQLDLNKGKVIPIEFVKFAEKFL